MLGLEAAVHAEDGVEASQEQARGDPSNVKDSATSAATRI